MCHFITLVAPTADEAGVRAVMARHARQTRSIDSRYLAAALRQGERQYLPLHDAGCDCGTVLAAYDPEEDELDEINRETARLSRKGWSSARITRALADQRKARARPSKGPDSLEFWAAAIQDLHASLGLSHVGLFLRSYTGDLDDEAFDPTRIDAPAGASLTEALATLGENRLMIFRA
jgi:hypothetical protein